MVKIISSLLENSVGGKHFDKQNRIEVSIHEKKVEDFIKKFAHRNFKVEWIQSSTTDGKTIFTTLSTIISTK